MIGFIPVVLSQHLKKTARENVGSSGRRTDSYGQNKRQCSLTVSACRWPSGESERFPATVNNQALVWKCVVVLFSSVASLISLFFTDWCPQCPDLTTPTHTQLHSTIYCYLHPQLLLLLLLLWLFLVLFLVVFSWSNIGFRLGAVVLVMRDVVKERNTAKTEERIRSSYWSYWVNHVMYI